MYLCRKGWMHHPLLHCKGTTRSPCTTTFILITSYFSAIISNLPRCLSSSRDLSQTIATIADHRRRPHSLAQPRTASPGFVTAAFQIWEAWYYTWSLVYTHFALTKVP